VRVTSYFLAHRKIFGPGVSYGKVCLSDPTPLRSVVLFIRRSCAPRVQTQENQIIEASGPERRPAWAYVWHLWTVFVPRRAVTRGVVCGRVWRRHNGRHWIYKRFVEFENSNNEF
jgi:hypothetical protein